MIFNIDNILLFFFFLLDGVEEEIQIQDLRLQLQLSMQLFYTIEQSTGFDQQIENAIQLTQKIHIQLSSVQQSQDNTGF